MKIYKVVCTLMENDPITGRQFIEDFSGTEHRTREDAEMELDEALEHPAVFSAWIHCEDDLNGESATPFIDWLFNERRGDALKLYVQYVRRETK